VSDGKGSVARNAAGVMPARYAGAIIAGFDVYLGQITFDCVDSQTGEVTRGRIASEPAAVQDWVGQCGGREVHVAMQACTGWRFVARAVQRAGGTPHLAETVEPRALRDRKRRAKTDRQDAQWLRELLAENRLPEAWIGPEHVRQWRSGLHLGKALIDERTQWLLRIRSVLYHHGLSAGAPGEISSPTGRAFLKRLKATRRRARTGHGRPIDGRHARSSDPPDRARATKHRAPPNRLPSAHDPVRRRRTDRPDLPLRARRRQPPVQLAQGSSLRRTGHRRAPLRSNQPRGQAHPPRLIAAALGALRSRPVGHQTPKPRPDYAHDHALRASGMTHTRASLTIARKITKRSYHLLHDLGPSAPSPAPE
jgi:Transposase